MKTCQFCAEEILDTAIKCRYCHSFLVTLPAEEVKKPDDKTVTYIVDTGLLQFAKFSGSILAIFLLVGAFLYGFDLKQAAKEIKDAHEESVKVRKDLQDGQEAAHKLAAEANAMLVEAKNHLGTIREDAEKVRGITSTLPQQVMDGDDLTVRIRDILAPVLNEDQLNRLKTEGNFERSTVEEVRAWVKRDIEKAVKYFKEQGLKANNIPFKIDAKPDFLNTYWDGKLIVYGMGMANSKQFGPYEPSLVMHEATHSLFNIEYEGQSGAVSEHLCDVMAVVIRGGDWTLGSVRGGKDGKPQSIRSLSNPGTAYDNESMGKDVQVAHMKEYVDGPDGRFSNSGILNKAAFLIAEGGEFRGVKVGKGIGRPQLGKLYAKVIRGVSQKPAWTFAQFRDLVLQVAKNEANGDDVVATVRASFAAVGL